MGHTPTLYFNCLLIYLTEKSFKGIPPLVPYSIPASSMVSHPRSKTGRQTHSSDVTNGLDTAQKNRAGEEGEAGTS